MAGKLDQSLDDILKTRRGNSQRGRGRGRRVPGVGRTTAVVAPVGGVTKNVRVGNAGRATHPVVPITGNGESKIIVTGLPFDVTETQIKDYFTTTIGPVKRAHLTYGSNGQSRGISTIVFNKPGSAVEAATQLNGVKVDGRAMKIEVVVGADQAPVPVPAKALGERIAKPKNAGKAQPKPATTGSGPMNVDSEGGRGRGRSSARGRGRGGRRSGRGKPKTTDELDAEMTDYFGAPGANGGAANPTDAGTGSASAAAAAGGDTGMDDEIM